MGELDSSHFDLSIDSEPDVVANWILSPVLESAEAFPIDEDLDGEVLVDNGQIESDVLLERELALPFLRIPESIAMRVADDLLLLEPWVEVEQDVLIASNQIERPAIATWDSVQVDPLTLLQVTGWEASLPRQLVESASPVDSVEGEISTDGQVLDGLEWQTMLELVNLLVVSRDLQHLIEDSDPKVKVLAGMERQRLALFFSPCTVLEN